jgi:hypothetical protein
VFRVCVFLGKNLDISAYLTNNYFHSNYNKLHIRKLISPPPPSKSNNLAFYPNGNKVGLLVSEY